MSRRAAGSQNQEPECGPSPPLPSDHVLGSGAVLFPGVFDHHGCPLIMFPADGQDRLLELSKAEVVDFIHYFHALLNKKQEKPSLVSVVADLRHASPPTTRFITETLLLLEEHKRTVQSVYIIQPKKKEALKLLLKLLVPAKSCSASFRNILLKEIPELWNYVDRSQLPASLGGYFLYCHRSWVSFIKEIDAFVQEFLSVVQRLPSCISTLQSLSRLPLPSSLNELQHFCSANEAKFLQLRRELGLDELLRHCEAVCEKLRHPDREPCYQAMAGTPFFTQTAFDMLQNHSRITAAVEKVELLWQQAFAKAHLQLQVLQLQSGALQIFVKMDALQEKLQLYRVESAKDSTTAAMLLSDFEAALFTPAMALVRCAEDVIHTLEEVFPGKLRTEERWALDLQRRKENLHSAVHFILQSLRAVSAYHQYYSKVNRWYGLVLTDRFLPELLSGLHGDQQNSHLRTAPAWRQRLSTFLKKNPPPDVEELLHLAQLSAAVPDDEQQQQQAGRRLSQRCLILRNLLTSSGPVSVEQLQLALQWQYELLRASHGSLNSEGDKVDGSSAVKRSPSGMHENRPEAGNHPVTSRSPRAAGLVSADWSPPLEASGGKDVEILQTLPVDCEPLRHQTSLSSVPDVGCAAIQIIPTVEAESLNLEIKVRRSAAPPTNPWLSLPVEDLENSYTVTITPKPTPHKNRASWERSVPADEETRLSHADESSSSGPREPRSPDLMLHTPSGSADPELSPICSVLSSTMTEAGEESVCATEGVPTLLWDSYDLHHDEPGTESLMGMSLDWEVKEQENLKEVERILNKTDGILKEEEHVLAQEAALDALLRDGNEKDFWPQWHSKEQLDEGCVEPAEAGVLGFQDRPEPGGSDPLSEGRSEGKAGSGSEDGSCTEEPLDSRLDLLHEMRSVDSLDQLIIEEENLKIHELRRSQGGSDQQPSENLSVTHTELQEEKREVEQLEKSLDEAAERQDGAPESGRSSVTEGSETEPTQLLAAASPRNTSGFCDMKECSVVVQPQTVCGTELNPSTPENKRTSQLLLRDGEFDPGGNRMLLSEAEPDTSSPPGNGVPIKPEAPPTDRTSGPEAPPTSRGSEPAPSLPSQQPPDLKPETLGDSLQDVTVGCRKDFLNPNVKEHVNNNNNNNYSAAGNFEESFSERAPVHKEKPSVVPVGFLLTEAKLPPVGPSQPQEFDPGGTEGRTGEDSQNSDSVRISDHVAQRVHTQSWEDNIAELADVKTPVVLDIGSGLMKAGFANQDLPNILFPTITGVPKYEEIMNGTLDRDIFIGHDAQHMRGVLTLRHPIKNGIICNWDDMEKMWNYTFQELCVDPEDHPVLLTEAAMNPVENRQRMVEIMFERFGVPFAYVAMQAVLALYAAGRTTGVVFDSGEGVSHSVPVFEGYGLPHAVQRFLLAGLDVTLQLKKLLQEQGVCMRTTAEDQIVREMKEKCCCVALNYEAELTPGRSSCSEVQYTMPDGQVVTLGTERFRAPEILFRPEMIGRDHYGMHESIFKSILRSDIDLRRVFLGNIVLSGGNTLLPGLPERVQAEIRGLVPADMSRNVCVSSPRDRDFLVWSGGAVLASLSTFSSAWISRGEYEEYGPQIVFRKCF